MMTPHILIYNRKLMRMNCMPCELKTRRLRSKCQSCIVTKIIKFIKDDNKAKRTVIFPFLKGFMASLLRILLSDFKTDTSLVMIIVILFLGIRNASPLTSWWHFIVGNSILHDTVSLVHTRNVFLFSVMSYTLLPLPVPLPLL